jgi:dihydroorotate dehydrogenase electron transfer subunit
MNPFVEKATVLENILVSPDSHVVVFSSASIGKTAQPGQFVEVGCDPGRFVLKRPFSVFEATNETLSLYIKRVGEGTRWLQQLSIGETVDIIGPLGNGYRVPDHGRSLLIGGGCGLASLKTLSRKIRESGGYTDIILGFRTEAEIPDRIIDTFREHTATIILATESGTNTKTGTVVDCLREININEYGYFFCCGPIGMLKALLPLLNTRNTFVSLEMRMACGLGVCYGCSVRTVSGLKRVCQDGPVFPMKEVEWRDL